MFDNIEVHPPHLREQALLLRADGVQFGDICRQLGLPRWTVGSWLHGERSRRIREKRSAPSRCFRCSPKHNAEASPEYAYLLGLYLGDGHLVTSTKVPVLRIYCTASWPGLISMCHDAMSSVLARRVHQITGNGCTTVQSYSNHWPCLLPQHGPGKKHDRDIVLTDWQQPIIDKHPGHFLRGLFHSDGCRSDNKIVKGDKTYVYPRYMFSNESADIMGLCQQSLDRLGISWKKCRRNMLSVARKEAVAALDVHVGPKW
jgi:hypothetical protein